MTTQEKIDKLQKDIDEVRAEVAKGKVPFKVGGIYKKGGSVFLILKINNRYAFVSKNFPEKEIDDENLYSYGYVCSWVEQGAVEYECQLSDILERGLK